MAPTVTNLVANPSQSILFVHYKQDGVAKLQQYDFADHNSRSAFIKFVSYAMRSGIVFHGTADESVVILENA